ncbi:TonB-dependent receptor [Sphingomonas mesophila]|uniref:TonB-dependent receptor n=1 Tax=Sphingomonas mesophila TaxID=2303576 RepID=UPI000E58F9E1|nr:TonB-dependent receptor [Sphingomonas mesophila]
MKKLILLSSASLIFPAAAFAQSAGTQDFEEEAIIVTGTRAQDVGGVTAPDTSKAKAVLTQEFLARQNPGQTVLDSINVVPGVSFQNNDAYGSSGGTLSIRGFDSSRISLTYDGIPLNDSGNYAIYSNQQIDPELIDQVNVNLGTTDVDSPTASAVGGTVNLRTRNPFKEFGARVVGSLGEYDFRRIFAVVDTGELGPWGTRTFLAVSTAKNDNPFNNYGKVDKQQYNAKIYQPLGAAGDFVSVSGHYNQNRNNFFGSLRLRNDITQSGTNGAPRVVGSGNGNRFPLDNDEREYDINYPCTIESPTAGVADAPAVAPAGFSSCGTEFDRRYNPSNTGNIKGTSRFTINDALTLTVEPSFQYVKANGGGTVTLREGLRDINPAGGTASTTDCALGNNATRTCVAGYFGGSPFAGRDVNGDGDVLDQVTVIAPSQTRTRRYGLISGLRWDINDDHTMRFNYTFDHANHRQTGEVGLLSISGEPLDVFPINDPVSDGNGVVLQKRDRQSYAILHQPSAEWRGEFFDDRLTTTVGVRMPFFTRKLDNNCFTSSASNSSGAFVECSGGNAAVDALIAANNPYVVDPVTGAISGFSPPQKRTLKYEKLLPNIGFIYDITPRASIFANYAKGLSVPSTDNLYASFFFPEGTDQAKPEPEETDSFDFGARYRSSKVQAQVGVWKTRFKNRQAVSFDPEANTTVFRNLGVVDKWGIDGSVAYSPIKQLTLYAFAAWNDSEIKDNIQIGAIPVSAFNPAGTTCDTIATGTVAADAQAARSCAFTAGKREGGAATYNWGFSALGSFGPIDLGITAKKTGPRYIYDNNSQVFRGDVDLTGVSGPQRIYSATAPSYWLINLDARYNFKIRGMKETYFQLNVYNLFDELYVGGFNSNLNQPVSGAGVYDNPPNAQIGAPRTISGTLSIAY